MSIIGYKVQVIFFFRCLQILWPVAMVLLFATSRWYGWMPPKFAGSFWIVSNTHATQRAAGIHLFRLQDIAKNPNAGQMTNQLVNNFLDSIFFPICALETAYLIFRPCNSLWISMGLCCNQHWIGSAGDITGWFRLLQKTNSLCAGLNQKFQKTQWWHCLWLPRMYFTPCLSIPMDLSSF